MNSTLSQEELVRFVARQLRQFYPDGVTFRTLVGEVGRALPGAWERLAVAIEGIKGPLFHRDGVGIFNHLHSDQYAMFLYLLANEAGCRNGLAQLATKIYLLNKALHGIDAFYEIELPRVFLFAHPLGTVLGRASYGECFMVMQNCTVCNVRGVYPKFGKGVVLCSGASVIGAAELGDAVTLGAGSLVIGAMVPANSTVIGRGKSTTVTQSGQSSMWTQYFKG
jgi:serine O-acetyltransferase